MRNECRSSSKLRLSYDEKMRAMTSDNVLKFLGNREYLHQVSYQELKSLVVQYPYSLSLRYLLAMKSKQEDNTDVGRNIELLATYGIDRAHLHKIFSEDPIVLEDLEETVVMGEDFLELKELSTLEREIEETQFIKTANNLQFLEETIPTSDNNLSFSAETPIVTPPPVVETSEILDTELEEEISTEGIEVKIEEELVESKAEPTLILETAPEVVEEEVEEEFVEMDFESILEKEEVIGIPTALPEVAPSESFSVKEEIFKNTDGLPNDAIEVNDLFVENEEVGEPSLEELFNESEQEAIAEEAVSDSAVFVENPKELLDVESKASLSEEIAEQQVENITEENTPKKPIIPFEISYTNTDPQTLENQDVVESIAIPSANTLNKVVEDPIETALTLPGEDEAAIDVPVVTAKKVEELIETPIVATENEEEVEEIIEDSVATVEEVPEIVEPPKEILPEQQKRVLPEPAMFKFDSLDQFEVALSENKFTQFSKPLPKTDFSSWREKYSGVNTFSGANLDPISKSGGKVIKKKKKVLQKKFKDTVAFAEESLRVDTHIGSETLAQLLVKQGQYSRAKRMYEALSLTMPEKSSFFAAEIEKIQNLPDEDS